MDVAGTGEQPEHSGETAMGAGPGLTWIRKQATGEKSNDDGVEVSDEGEGALVSTAKKMQPMQKTSNTTL